MMKTIFLFFIFLLFSSFLESEEVEAFYVVKKGFPKEAEIVKLSLSKKEMKELENKIKYYNDISEKTWSIMKEKGIFYMPPFLEENDLPCAEFCMKSGSGERRIISYFVKKFPFSLHYMKIAKDSHIFISYYSIEEFFSPEEKKKMIELIPEWSPENIKKREKERKKEEEKRKKEEGECSSFGKKQEEKTN